MVSVPTQMLTRCDRRGFKYYLTIQEALCLNHNILNSQVAFETPLVTSKKSLAFESQMLSGVVSDSFRTSAYSSLIFMQKSDIDKCHHRVFGCIPSLSGEGQFVNLLYELYCRLHSTTERPEQKTSLDQDEDYQITAIKMYLCSTVSHKCFKGPCIHPPQLSMDYIHATLNAVF